jgi:hypothetical protein
VGRGIDRTVTFTPVVSADQEDIGRVAAGGSVFEWVRQRLAELPARLPGLDDAGYAWLEQAGVMADLAETLRVAAGQAAEHWSGEPAAVELQRALAALWGTAERMGAAASLMGRFVQACAQHAREAGGRFAEQAVQAREAEQVGPELGQSLVVGGGPVLSVSDQVAWQVFDGLNHAWQDEAQHTAPHELRVTYPFPETGERRDTGGSFAAAWDDHSGGSAGLSGDDRSSGGSAGLDGSGSGGGGGSYRRQPVSPDPAGPPGGGVGGGGGVGSPSDGGSSLAGGAAGGVGGAGLSGFGGGTGAGSGQPGARPGGPGPGESGVPGGLGSPSGPGGLAGRSTGPGSAAAPGSAGRSGVVVPPTGGHGKDDEQERERRYWLCEDEAWVVEESPPGVLMGEYRPPSDDDDEDADW